MLNKKEKETEIWFKDILDNRSVFEKDQEFNNLLLYGTTHPEILPNTFINLGDGSYRFERLTKEEVVEKYGYLLTEEEKEKLLK